MSSTFFRRPTDSSSSSSSSSADSTSDEDDNSHPQLEDGVEVDGQTETTTTESLASHGSSIVEEGANSATATSTYVDHHRSNLLSALLEDFAKTRACEMMSSASQEVNFTRSSPEIQPLARTLYQHLSQSLARGGLLPVPPAGDIQNNQQTRATYLAGIEGLALSSVQTTDVLSHRPQLPPPGGRLAVARSTAAQQQGLAGRDALHQQMATLSLFQNQAQFSSPYSDLTFATPPPYRSHYDSSFQQLRLLGKGGFGRVYHTYNIFDKKEYAVKKIPLSPRLSQRYRESGHQELENVLREVQALAQLEHNNVVRYHATWIEEPRRLPRASNPPGTPNVSVQGRRLLAEAEASGVTNLKPRPRMLMSDHSDGIVFGNDSATNVGAPEAEEVPTWSQKNDPSEPDTLSLSARTSDIFTDGVSRPSIRQQTEDADDSVYVLHVQMSVYPMTLAQYLAPPSPSSESAPGSFRRRHCFHLVPALRILMGILCGLQYIHAKGLVHRDIKPSNIFLSILDVPTAASPSLASDGYHDVGSCFACPRAEPYFVNPRIGDFGLVADLARDRDKRLQEKGGGEEISQKTIVHKPVGTEYYRPPAPAHPVDEKLDVFALGVTLVEMLWCCTTNSERLHILRDLQKGILPAGFQHKIESEGYEEGTGRLVVQGILGMIDRDRRRRWSCAQVQEWGETILKRCTKASCQCGETQPEAGEVLTKVVTLESEPESEQQE